MLSKLFFINILFLFNPSVIEYEIVEIYKGIVPENGTMVLTSFNNIEETELILVPVKIDAGNYSMKVTRKAKDLYGVDGFNIFIRTRFCTVHSFNADVIVKIVSGFEGSRGKIVFSD